MCLGVGCILDLARVGDILRGIGIDTGCFQECVCIPMCDQDCGDYRVGDIVERDMHKYVAVSIMSHGITVSCSIVFRKQFVKDFDIDVYLKCVTEWSVVVVIDIQRLCIVLFPIHLPHHSFSLAEFGAAPEEVAI